MRLAINLSSQLTRCEVRVKLDDLPGEDKEILWSYFTLNWTNISRCSTSLIRLSLSYQMFQHLSWCTFPYLSAESATLELVYLSLTSVLNQQHLSWYTFLLPQCWISNTWVGVPFSYLSAESATVTDQEELGSLLFIRNWSAGLFIHLYTHWELQDVSLASSIEVSQWKCLINIVPWRARFQTSCLCTVRTTIQLEGVAN